MGSFNSLVFPKPDFNKYEYNQSNKNLIFIPRKPTKANSKKSYIPCLYLPHENSNKILIFFHGNAEDIFLANYVATDIKNELKMNILIPEYPGYSIYNDIDVDSEVLLEDTLILYDYIVDKFKLQKDNIFIYGRSIGNSPAAYLASNRQSRALFLISSFTSIQAVAKNMVGYLNVFLKNRFLTEKYITKVTCPVIFIHGKKDPLIPYTESETLYGLCKSSIKDCFYPEDMTHNDFNLYDDIINHIIIFLKHKCNYDINEQSNEEIVIDSSLFEKPDEVNKRINELIK